MTPEEHARHSWQSSATAAALPPLDELRSKADRFQRKIKRRNWIEYGAGVFVIVSFAFVFVRGPLPWHEGHLRGMQIGSALAIVGVLVVMWQLHRRASPLSPPEHGGQLSVLAFQRSEYARQRDALNSIFTWYLLPLIPGMLVIMASPLFAVPMSEWRFPPPDVVLHILMAPAMFVGVWWINKFAARKLQREIDQIDVLSAE